MLRHAAPSFGLPWHTPVHGDDGLPTHGLPLVEPMRQIGHGCVPFPVRITLALSERFAVASPVERSIVPLAGAVNVFATQVDTGPFGTGSGGPKLQPVSVQSNVAPCADVAPSVHDEPVQLAVKRLVDPSGASVSGAFEFPPPTSSPPQVRSRSTVVPVVSL